MSNFTTKLTNFFSKFHKPLILLAILGVITGASLALEYKDASDKISFNNVQYRKSHQLSELHGQVVNSDTITHDVEVKVFFYGPDGGTLSVEKAEILDVSANGQKPFSLFTSNDVSGYERYEIKVLNTR